VRAESVAEASAGSAPERLTRHALARLPAEVAVPRYDRSAVRPGVVHLGIGAFHRAHQAVVFDDLLAAGDRRWGVLGASLRSPAVRDQLSPQDGLYTVLAREGDREEARVVGAVQEVAVAPEDPARLLEAMASPEVHLVTLTVTEKGYKLDPASGGLLAADPDVAADLRNPMRPRTAPGFLSAALSLRRRRGLRPFTVLSCDNLPGNGARVRGAVLAFAEVFDKDLRTLIAEEGAFPATMVDRIVPATTPADVARLAARIGFVDQGMVKTEPFTQWVVEDRFAGPRPDLAAAGVQLTADVAPWEEAKLRLLNGAHSALAYLGALSGAEFVHQAAARPDFSRFLDRLWDEAAETLQPPPELDLAAYRSDLRRRFGNAALQHRTVQIAMDGSQKLPQRLLNSIRGRLERGCAFECLSLGAAAWMRWQLGVDEQGRPFVVDDPLAERTHALAAAAAARGGGGAALAGAMLDNLPEVFSEDLRRSAPLRDSLAAHLDVLLTRGAEAAVARALGAAR